MTQEQSIFSKIVTIFAAELMNKGIIMETLTMKEKDKKQYKKNFIVNLLELIQLKKVLIFLLKLAKYNTTLLNQLRN